MQKSNKQTIIIVSIMMGLILCTFLLTSINAKQTPISKPNYLGLAELGLIPTTIQCTHAKESYISTDVVIINKQDGSKYLILQSKFGDESCLIKI